MVKEFPLLPLEKLAKKAGAERIAREALLELRSILLEWTSEVAKQAVELCAHARRVTVKKEDVELAVKRW